MKKLLILVAVLLSVGLAAQAAEFVAPSKGADPNVSTQNSEKHHNLYIAGATNTINSNTTGDLFAAGGVVTVNGNVEKDLFVGGGHISLNGTVGDDLRVAGGNVSISSPVGGDLLVAGGNVSVAQKASVGADLAAAGGNLVFDSTVKGNAKISGGNVVINGKISGNLEVTATQNLTFGPNSEVTGTINYKGVKPAVVKDGAKVGTINYTKIAKPRARGDFRGLFVAGSLLKLLMLLAAAAVLYLLFPSRVKSIVAEAIRSPWANLGIGLLVLIVSPILAIILCVTVVGVYLGLATFLIYILFLLLAAILSLFYIGRLIMGWVKRDSPANHWLELLVGALVSLILGFIPVLGWLALLVIYMITLGSIFTLKRKEIVRV